VDDYSNTAGQFGIRSIPTLILFKDGLPVDQVIGAVSKSKLEEMILRHQG
jgi:thioredoxin 1